MKIEEKLITPNEYSRPQKQIKKVLAIVLHWTADCVSNADAIRNYFESLGTAKTGYSSAHYVIGQDGKIIRCIPENEIAYHCGSSKTDPKSRKLYTDLARQKFANFATENSSPNFCTIGIEMCPINLKGDYTDLTLLSAIELCANLCKRYGLTVNDLVTHHDVVGWKDCPRLWVDNPSLFKDFKIQVKNLLEKEKAK